MVNLLKLNNPGIQIISVLRLAFLKRRITISNTFIFYFSGKLEISTRQVILKQITLR